MTELISTLQDVSDRYDAMFVDLWGCVHNGLDAFPAAVAALQAYRRRGGVVALVTNAPRPRDSVAAQIKSLGVDDDAWDVIATSGDSARLAMFEGVVGNDVYFIGEDRDHSFFEPLKLATQPQTIRRVPLDDAEGIVCCGPFDPLAPPDDLRPQLLAAKQRGLKLLCANPDIVVDRGERREWCAGAIAQLYTEMGGESLYFGKPHPPIYDLARRRLSDALPNLSDDRILAVGDGIATDIAGAMGENIDSLFITGGLAAEETKTKDDPDPQALRAYLDAQQASPTFAIGFLR